MHLHAKIGEGLHSLAHIHGIAAEAVQLGDDKNVTSFELLHEFFKPWPLTGGNAP